MRRDFSVRVFRVFAHRALVVLLVLGYGGVAHATDTYNPSNHQLTIPIVTIGNGTYSSVVVTVNGLVGSPTGTTAGGTTDSYNPISNQLTIPAVTLGNSTYYNVIATVSSLVSIGSASRIDSYNGTDLTIVAVQVLEGPLYYNVVLAASINNVLSIGGGMPQAIQDQYNPGSNQLFMPAVQVGGKVYTNVTITAGAGSILTVGGTGSLVTPTPGSRSGSASWTDSLGNLWLFGGQGTDGSGVTGLLNDLWEYVPALKSWVWVGGSNAAGTGGVYGGQGVASLTAAPGARIGATTWTDTQGHLWLFGGQGIDSTGAMGDLGDLWQYAPETHAWTWVGGSTRANPAGSYGTPGIASTGNMPGGRSGAISLLVPPGDIVLFGGQGYDSAGNTGYLNDIWVYVQSANAWEWIGGSKLANASGTYGALGASSTSYAPGGRVGAAAWTDSSGDIWFFGGQGIGAAGASGYLADLWEVNPTNGKWTWVAGPNTPQSGASASNAPGARAGAVSWTDAAGNLWLFGGQGYGPTGTLGYLNDLWQFNPASLTWTLASPQTPMPSARLAAGSWLDTVGNVWVFGGAGVDSTGAQGLLNDLWQLAPGSTAGAAGTWTHVIGPTLANIDGVYGLKGGLPTLTFFPPEVTANYAAIFGYIDASFQQMAFTGTYPNETLWTASGGGYGGIVWAIAPNGSMTGFSPMSGNATPSGGIVTGPDGAVWVPVVPSEGASSTLAQLARIDSSGNETDYPLSSLPAGATSIAVGPDGNLWITSAGPLASNSGIIGRVTTSGTVGQLTTLAIKGSIVNAYGISSLNVSSIVRGPNSALWFLETESVPDQVGATNYNYLGEITTSGQVFRFGLPGPAFMQQISTSFTPTTSNNALCAGSDGNLWIAGYEYDSVGRSYSFGVLRVTPQPQSTNTPPSTFFPLPDANYVIAAIVSGPDGAIWGSLEPQVATASPALMRMTTSGALSYIPIPPTPAYYVVQGGSQMLGWDPSGVLWFDVYTGQGNEAFIGRYQTQ